MGNLKKRIESIWPCIWGILGESSNLKKRIESLQLRSSLHTSCIFWISKRELKVWSKAYCSRRNHRNLLNLKKRIESHESDDRRARPPNWLRESQKENWKDMNPLCHIHNASSRESQKENWKISLTSTPTPESRLKGISKRELKVFDGV